MENQTAKSIDRSLKSIASSLQRIEKNTRPVIRVHGDGTSEFITQHQCVSGSDDVAPTE